jgi:hypothetical protein
MSFRDWRARRFVGLALGWVLGVLVWAAVVSAVQAQRVQLRIRMRKSSSAPIFQVACHSSWGPGSFLSPRGCGLGDHDLPANVR